MRGWLRVGRGFDDFDDLNRQAVDWCRNVANHKPKQALGMSPEAAYIIEQPHLVPLPDALPPVYELLERVVDLHGYVSVDTNRYSVPERYVGKSVAVYKLPAEIHVCRKDLTIAVHRRLIGERDARSTLPGQGSPCFRPRCFLHDPVPSLQGDQNRYRCDSIVRSRGLRGRTESPCQTAEDVVEWQQCAAAELNDDGFLGRGQDGALRFRSHG